jgi:hypothetical protein
VRAAGGEPSGGEVDLARIGLQARAGTSTGSLTRPKQSAQEKGATTSFTASAYWKFESTPLQERDAMGQAMTKWHHRCCL